MVYLVETFHLTDNARFDPAFADWFRRFNALTLRKNPAIKSLSAFTSYSGPFELEIWFGMDDFSSLDESERAEQTMARDPEVTKELGEFVKYLTPVGRRIMRDFQ